MGKKVIRFVARTREEAYVTVDVADGADLDDVALLAIRKTLSPSDYVPDVDYWDDLADPDVFEWDEDYDEPRLSVTLNGVVPFRARVGWAIQHPRTGGRFLFDKADDAKYVGIVLGVPVEQVETSEDYVLTPRKRMELLADVFAHWSLWREGETLGERDV